MHKFSEVAGWVLFIALAVFFSDWILTELTR